MPTIPSSRSNQVRRQAFSSGGFNAKVPTAPSRMNELQVVADTVNNLGAIALKEEQKAEAIELDAFESALRDEKNRQLHDKDNGFYNQRGKNSLDNFKNYDDGYGSFIEERLGAIGNQSLKEKASLIAQKYKGSFNKDLNVHTAREMERYDDEQTQANISSVVNDAVLNYDAPVNQSLMKVEAYISGEKTPDGKQLIKPGYAQRKGMSREEEQQALTKAYSAIHEGRIMRAIENGDNLLARDMYEALKAKDARKGKGSPKELSAESISKLDRIVRGVAVKGESEAIVSKLNPELDYNASLEAIRNDPRAKDTEVRDAAIQRYKLRFQEEKVAKNFAENAYFQKLGDKLMTDPANFNLTPEDMSKLSFSQQRQLMAAKSEALRASQGHTKKSDIAEYDRLMSLSSSELAKEKVFLNGKLSHSDKVKFIDLQRDERKHQSAQTMNNFLKDMLVDIDDQEEESFIRGEFEKQLNQYPKDEQGKTKTWSEIRNSLFMDMDRAWPRFNQPSWKVKMRGEKGLKPVDRPAAVNPEAKYLEQPRIFNGKRAVWQEGEGEGTMFFDAEGNLIGTLQRK